MNVAKLTDFYAYDSGWLKKWKWFDAARALVAVNAILNHLERNPNDLGFEPDAPRRHWPESLMRELRECRRVLEGAVATGNKFRFLIVS